MRQLLRVVALDAPAEALFFESIGVFGLAIATVYWLVSYETAGTVLLTMFGLVTGGAGVVLARAASEATRDIPPGEAISPMPGPTVDSPFRDDALRLPAPTLAPFAMGLGIAVAALGLVFGPAPVIVGILPIVWAGLTWLGRARAELGATEAEADEPGPGGAVSSPGGATEPRRMGG
jgi:hypothetical protein